MTRGCLLKDCAEVDVTEMEKKEKKSFKKAFPIKIEMMPPKFEDQKSVKNVNMMNLLMMSLRHSQCSLRCWHHCCSSTVRGK